MNLIRPVGGDHPGYDLKTGACGDRRDVCHFFADGLDVLRAIEIDHGWLVLQRHDRRIGHHSGQAAFFEGFHIRHKAIKPGDGYG